MFTAVHQRSALWTSSKRRRTATAVLAGDFDPRPPRDVLTSLLNGVGPYRAVEHTDEERRIKKLERRAREKEKMKMKKLAAARLGKSTKGASVVPRASSMSGSSAVASGSGTPSRLISSVNHNTSSFWRSAGLPPAPMRSVSPSPPPDDYSPPTPGPSTTSTVSRTSSKRPHTPDDYFLFDDMIRSSVTPPPEDRPRKKRGATKKGWKGWVEGSPPPSDKLINLDSAPVLRERRTRSGKNFDAISEGTERWVSPGKATTPSIKQWTRSHSRSVIDH